MQPVAFHFDWARTVIRRLLRSVCLGVLVITSAMLVKLSNPIPTPMRKAATAASEVSRNAEMIGKKIPPALWRDLKAADPMRADAPTPR